MIKYFFAKFIKKINLPAIKKCKIDKKSKICSGSHLINVSTGKYSYIGNFCTVINCKIGSFNSIADNCIIGGASHPMQWVSTSPVFIKGRNCLRKNFSNHEYQAAKKTIIENDVWIGNNCLIKSGIVIGNGAIIGMGSVVTKNVPAYEVWAGNPAHFIKRRFDCETAQKLNESEWWNFSDKKIEQYASSITLIDEFLSKIRKDKEIL